MQTRFSFTVARRIGAALLVFSILPGVANGQRATGLAPEEPVEFEVFRDMPKYRDYLPAKTDLSDFFPPARNQGNQGSCTAWATAYGLRSFYNNVENRSVPAQGLSPAFVYNQLKTKPNDCTEPLRISDALKFLEKRGTVPIEQFPYNAASCTEKPSSDIQGLAGDFTIDGWRRINHMRLDDIKGELAQGNPVVIGMAATKEFETLQGDSVYRDEADSERTLTHAMVLVGYDEQKEAFRAFNSWGTDWGENGIGWIGYEPMQSDLDSAFVAHVRNYSLDTLVSARVDIAERSGIASGSTVLEPADEQVENAQTAGSLLTGLWKTDLSSVAGTLSCANLSMSMQAGNLNKLGGYVSSEQDLSALSALLGRHAETKDAKLSVDVRPWPQCEALTTFARTFARPQGLTVSVVSSDGQNTDALQQDELLGIQVRTPDFPAYLYITYLQSGGDAVHLVGWQGGEKVHPANTDVTFGLDPSKPRFRIGPPFGSEMVIAVASHQPLFGAGYDILEEERTYLTRFRQRMLEIGNRKITGQFAASAVYVETSASNE